MMLAASLVMIQRNFRSIGPIAYLRRKGWLFLTPASQVMGLLPRRYLHLIRLDRLVQILHKTAPGAQHPRWLLNLLFESHCRGRRHTRSAHIVGLVEFRAGGFGERWRV